MAEFEKVEFEFPDEVEAKGKPVEEIEEEPETKIEIEVEDDAPEEDRNRKPTAKESVDKLEIDVDELDNYSKDARDKMIRMKKIWHDERRRADSAEREREAALKTTTQLFEENKRIKSLLNVGQTDYIAAVKTSADLEMEMAKTAYREAHESGDTERLLDAQQKITAASLKIDRVKNFKPPLQEEKFEVKREEQPRLDNKVIAWQSQNPWFGQDEEMTAAALGLHEKLKRTGVTIGSDDYYATLDKTMRKRFPEEFDEPEVKQKEDAPKAKPSTVVAPATRSTASKKIKLTTSQVAISKKLGLTPEQYVREVIKLEA